MDVQLPTIRVVARGAEAIRAGASVLNAQIQSQTKLKFGLYALASLCLIVAALLVVFAPDGRETISSIVAVALFVVAVGCAGFGAFAIKTPPSLRKRGWTAS
jgi:predicted RND superfamily exporter protein